MARWRRSGILGACWLGSMALAAAGQCEADEVAKLLAPDGAQGDVLGHPVAISGDALFAGATGQDDLGVDSGAAYVFERRGGAWEFSAKLLASDGAPGDRFGNAVAVSGEIAIVGCARSDTAATDAGAAYVFERVGGVWTEVAKLTAFDGAEEDRFGIAASVSGETAVIGAYWDDQHAGSAYVFERVAGVWRFVAKLIAPDREGHDIFGFSVSVSGDAIVCSAMSDGENVGAAYVFEKIGGAWTLVAKIVASDGSPNDRFGHAASISGDLIVIGAEGDQDRGVEAGSAYIFQRIDGAWTEVAKLLASDGGPNDRFGCSAAISGQTAVVGSYSDDDLGVDAGSAFVYRRIGGSWRQVAKLLASDGAAEDRFGHWVAIDGQRIVAGARTDDDRASNAGAVFIFELDCACYADCDGDSALTVFDFLCFQNQFAAGDPAADCDGDGSLTFFDFLCVQNACAAGCP
ncbi:MAG: hypothetical protein ACF8R7_03995 [Phycisphaerales bacterium JB039]